MSRKLRSKLTSEMGMTTALKAPRATACSARWFQSIIVSRSLSIRRDEGPPPRAGQIGPVRPLCKKAGKRRVRLPARGLLIKFFHRGKERVDVLPGGGGGNVAAGGDDEVLVAGAAVQQAQRVLPDGGGGAVAEGGHRVDIAHGQHVLRHLLQYLLHAHRVCEVVARA